MTSSFLLVDRWRLSFSPFKKPYCIPHLYTTTNKEEEEEEEEMDLSGMGGNDQIIYSTQYGKYHSTSLLSHFAVIRTRNGLPTYLLRLESLKYLPLKNLGNE